MYDDNTTPTWTLVWAHGMKLGNRKGWSFAHVWPVNSLYCYTRLANLALVPECLAGLTDKDGPLTEYLRWHAWREYCWKPEEKTTPDMPSGYDELRWTYFSPISDPRAFIAEQFHKADNERSRALRRLDLRSIAPHLVSG
jgi:hypothetical protein